MIKKWKYENKRLQKCLIILVLSVFVFTSGRIVSSAEEGAEKIVNGKTEDVLDDFWAAVPDGVGGLGSMEEVTEKLGLKHILLQTLGTLNESYDELAAFLLSLLGISLISALASLLEKELSPYVSRAVASVSAAFLFNRLMFLVGGVKDTLSEINEFFAAVIPISLAVNSLGASPTAATTQAMGMGVTLGAYSFVAEKLLGGIAAAVFLTSALSTLDVTFLRLSKGVKSVFITLLGIVTVMLGATFSLQSTLSVSADSVAIRGARYAVSNAIPIVGGTVSGALGLVAGGIQYARGVVGAGAIAVVLSLILAPLVTLISYRLCLKLGVELCSCCSLDVCANLLTSFFGALDVLIATYSLTAVIYIVELLSFLKGGVGIA